MTINPLFVVAKGVWVSIFLLSFTAVCAQNQTIHAVLAGSEYIPHSESGMERIDYVYYFRPDGAFCNELDKPDWQKKTNGTYTIDGNQLKMKFLSDGAEKVILLSVTGETGQSGRTTFIKMDLASKVPPGLYKYTRMSGKQDALFFHESGRFGRGRFDPSATPVVKGKKAKPNNGEGFYTLAQSVLTLQYDNGRTETQSFFYSLDKTPIAVIDGKIYYGEEDQNLAKQTENATGTSAEDKTETTSPQPAAANEASTAMIILQSANLAHGGKFLDNINTIKAVMNTNNLTITMQADFQQQYLRMESAIDNNTILVEQLEGSTGWSYDGSGYTSLSPQRIREMQHTLYCGQLGLRSDVLSKSTVTLQKQQSGLSSVMVQVDNLRAGYIINNTNNRLEALILAGDNNATSSITYSDYKKVDNILLPFTETIQSGNHTQTIVYNKYLINPKLTKEDWAKP